MVKRRIKASNIRFRTVGATKAVLMALFVASGFLTAGGIPASVAAVYSIFENREKSIYEKKQIARALEYLKSRKLVDIQSQYQKEVFSLTKLGWLRARRLAKSFGIRKPEKWDGKWRIVIFDIPETKKSEREVFRNSLKNLGLANVQKSIWIHPYDCEDQVYHIAGNMFIKPYVRYIVAEKITGEKDLRQRFDL